MVAVVMMIGSRSVGRSTGRVAITLAVLFTFNLRSSRRQWILRSPCEKADSPSSSLEAQASSPAREESSAGRARNRIN